MVRDLLATRLKHYREASGMTIYEAGKRIGKSGKTVSAWENRRGQPDADMLLALCELYKIRSIADLYEEEASSAPALTPAERGLLDAFRQFNSEGREKILTYIDDLRRAGIYIGYTPPGAEQPRPRAPADHACL